MFGKIKGADKQGGKPMDTRGKKPDFKASTKDSKSLKEAVMGRSKLPVKTPNKKRDVYLS